MLLGMVDRAVLRPTKNPLPAAGKTQLLLPYEHGQVEVWRERFSRQPARASGQANDADAKPDVFVLKYIGAGGRAEHSTNHPADCWPDQNVEIWCVNPPGYGASTGPASLRHYPQASQAAYQAIRDAAGTRPILAMGTSLGTLPALWLAAEGAVAAVVLRTPPPLQKIIVTRHGWWNLWLLAFPVAGAIPREFNSMRNARRARVPAVFITATHDKIVPHRYQKRVIKAYGGDKKVLTLEGGHRAKPSGDDRFEYERMLSWVGERL
ncbi:MAG: alpha/beta hydrolase [Planctomycetales bacterium]